MGLVRTNITLPEETLALVDAVAGPRGRSRYIADVVIRQVRRDNARLVFEKYAGVLKGTGFWGRTDEETDQLLREVRDMDGAEVFSIAIAEGRDRLAAQIGAQYEVGAGRAERFCARIGARERSDGAV